MRSLLSLARSAARIVAAALALLCFVLAALLSPAPSLPRAAAPSAGEVRAGRDAVLALAAVASADGAPRPVRFTPGDLAAMAALTSYGFDALRVRPAVAAGVLRIEASLRPVVNAWVNTLVEVAPSGDGFPDVRLRAGQVELPAFAVRGLLSGVEWWARARGLDAPPLDSLVRSFAADASGVRATLAAPLGLRRVMRELLGSSGGGIDPALLHPICMRVAQTRGVSFAARLRAAFAQPRPAGVGAVDYNRAAFVALAMVAVDPRAGRLAGDAAADIACSPYPARMMLSGRDDLPKHFSLSAAMAAVIPPHVTRAMGEWKELDDSLPGGSGFSFVDLAADRAGLHLARAAVADERSAALVARRLASVRETDLLPPAARGLREGMDEASFRRRYGALDARAYARTVSEIDAMLAAMPLYAGLVQPE